MTAADLKAKQKKERYSKYADRFINENIRDAYDWTIFDSESFIMNGNSGTQTAMKYYGIAGLNTLS